MGLTRDALEALRNVVLMNDKLERLAKAVDKLEDDHAATRERLVRLETWFEVAREAAARRRALPRP